MFQLTAPDFWCKKNWVARSLYPLSYGYKLASSLSYAMQSVFATQIPSKVICVGNITVGGGGKTPLSMWLAEMVIKKGSKPFFLTRGYKGSIEVPVVVDNTRHLSSEVGDEALLLANIAPVVVAKNRILGAKEAINSGAEIIIMDDGYQNCSIKKDLSLLVIDREYGLGNGYLIPAGPLREPLHKAIKKADAVIVTGNKTSCCNLRSELYKKCGKNIIHSFIGLKFPQDFDFYGNYIAFAGIAQPQKFFRSLINQGIKLAETFSFPDHYAYDEAELIYLIEHARTQKAFLLTTEKDMMRIPHNLRYLICSPKIELQLEEEGIQAIDTMLCTLT
jgi:tetraacyldisaccharide 4'-kinase